MITIAITTIGMLRLRDQQNMENTPITRFLLRHIPQYVVQDISRLPLEAQVCRKNQITANATLSRQEKESPIAFHFRMGIHTKGD